MRTRDGIAAAEHERPETGARAAGFLFISSPAFGDFVVANSTYCDGGAQVQLRTVPTTDQPECLVNYCVPSRGFGTN